MTVMFTDLPNEIIYQILLCVPPESVTKVQQVSLQFNKLAQPILWRHHCATQFKYWDSSHGIQEKFSGPVAQVDWKKIFSERHRIDRTTSGAINSILETQNGRIKKTERIVSNGYDAKDTLLRHLNVGDEVHDVLARRFYSDAVLGNLHRNLAIQVWAKLRNGEDVLLERALAAFDMFVLRERKGDFEDVTAALDHIAARIQADDPEVASKTQRQKIIAISGYLRNNNLVGIDDVARYQDLQNNFIGIALHDENHPSLPLISVAILCCVASRFGVAAYPCAFPFHVLAIIKPSSGRNLDGDEINKDGASPPIYLDPFRSSQEIDVRDLHRQLGSMGVAPVEYAQYLDAASTGEIIRRCARNILASVQALPRHHGTGPVPTASYFPEMDGALYAALWSLILLPETHQHVASLQQAQYLRFIVERIESEYLVDVGLIEEYILPFISDTDEKQTLLNTVRVVRAGDEMPKQVKRRGLDTEGKVQYRVGQVFKHKRYNYQAVITGWDVECEAGDQWITTMNVRSLSRGQHQSFYHVLVEDKTVRYVAEENVEVITKEVDTKLMELAGQHFKRLDRTTMGFISNITDEYPNS